MFSKTCEYAIRALLFVARKSRGGARIGIKEVAAGIDSPEHFIAKILQDLGRRGLVLSAKGPNGGFYMDAACLKHTLADVVTAVDGSRIFSSCGLGLKDCSERFPCPIHFEYKAIRQQTRKMLQEAVIGDFIDKLGMEKRFLKR
jgi:Rrf2 family protein